ncbi:MAG: lipoprotein, partial [Mucispirillum sp.]|nr:lipoprotein [Mucispirillum sp.]
MKKLLSLFVICAALSGCSSDDDNAYNMG